MSSKYTGSEWLKKHKEISSLGEIVADLLGDLYLGIYHIDESVLHKRVDWQSEHRIEVTVSGSLATADDDKLTALVLLCHDRCVRCEIRAAAPGYLRLCFSPRIRSGPIYQRHDEMEAAISKIRSRFEVAA